MKTLEVGARVEVRDGGRAEYLQGAFFVCAGTSTKTALLARTPAKAAAGDWSLSIKADLVHPVGGS